MGLTSKQELFAINFVMNGGNGSKAYIESYDVGKDTKMTTIYPMASKLRKDHKIATRIYELQMEQYSPMIISIEDRKKLLTTQIFNEDLRAMEILNKMTGAYVRGQEDEYVQDEIIDG